MARSAAKKDQGEAFSRLLADLERGAVGPVYLLHGPETFLVERALELLRRAVAGDDDLAYELLRAGEVSGKDIVGAARTVSMFSPRRLLVVREVEALSADEVEPVLAYFEAPVAETCLVLVAAKVDKSRKLYKRADKNGWAFEAAPPTERGLPDWIVRRARAKGLELGPGAVEVLGEATGTDLATVDDALERLSLYVGDRRKADVRDVEAVVASSRVRSVFELTDALGDRDLAAALRTLRNMLDNREAPLRVVATLATHVRRLLGAAELGPRVLGDPEALAAKLAVHWFVAKKLAGQARRFEVPELRAALVRLARADQELKSARRPDPLVMEELVLDLCMPARPC